MESRIKKVMSNVFNIDIDSINKNAPAVQSCCISYQSVISLMKGM